MGMTAGTSPVSLSLDAQALAEARQFAESRGISVSALVSEALIAELPRLRLRALIADWEAEDPASPDDIERARSMLRDLWSGLDDQWLADLIPHGRPPGDRQEGARKRA